MRRHEGKKRWGDEERRGDKEGMKSGDEEERRVGGRLSGKGVRRGLGGEGMEVEV